MVVVEMIILAAHVQTSQVRRRKSNFDVLGVLACTFCPRACPAVGPSGRRRPSWHTIVSCARTKAEPPWWLGRVLIGTPGLARDQCSCKYDPTKNINMYSADLSLYDRFLSLMADTKAATALSPPTTAVSSGCLAPLRGKPTRVESNA